MDVDPATTPLAELQATHARLRAAWDARTPDLAQRRGDLLRLRAVFAQRLDAMDAAISADFGHRSTHENLVSEAMIVLAEIDHALRHLRRWMKPRRVGVGWRFWPARGEVRPLPVGVIGIIAPWNYPVNLALVPLVSAIAAGNHVYLKPSEQTPQTSQWLRALLGAVFPEDRVAVALGGTDVGAAFAALPFDHLLFTGSTAVARKVMAAAAPNLTPVTLELGGKAPAIIAADFPLDVAAARIASGQSGKCRARSSPVQSQDWGGQTSSEGRSERVVFSAMARSRRWRLQSSACAATTPLVATAGMPSRPAAASTAWRVLPGRSSA